MTKIEFEKIRRTWAAAFARGAFGGALKLVDRLIASPPEKGDEFASVLAGAVVTYCKPFCGARRDTLAPYPLKRVPKDQISIHLEAIDWRHKLLAHTDSSAKLKGSNAELNIVRLIKNGPELSYSVTFFAPPLERIQMFKELVEVMEKDAKKWLNECITGLGPILPTEDGEFVINASDSNGSPWIELSEWKTRLPKVGVHPSFFGEHTSKD